MEASRGIRALSTALSSPDFLRFTLGNSVSLIGTWMQRMATGWLAWSLTESGVWLGVVAFAELFPTVVVTPLAGAAADRWNRKRVVMITQTLAMLQAFALFLLVATGTITIWLLLFFTAFLGICAAFTQPARLSMVPSLVPRESLHAAVAVNSIVANLARFIGPALSAVLILYIGIHAVFLFNTLSFGAFLYALHGLSVPANKKLNDGKYLADFVAGLKYVIAHKGILSVLILLLATSLGGRPVIELLPGFAGNVFDAGPAVLASLSAAIGIGAILGGLSLNVAGDLDDLRGTLKSSSFAMGLGVMLFAMAPSYHVALPMLVLTGFGFSRTGIAAQTLIQLSVDEALRGRVISVYGMIFRGGPAIGALVLGGASHWLGLQLSVFLGSLIVFAAWAKFLRDTR